MFFYCYFTKISHDSSTQYLHFLRLQIRAA